MGNPESKTLPPGSPTGSPFESINEPPGSQVIPEGAGAGTGEEVEHPPGSIPEGPTGPAEEEAPTIEALDPDEAEVGSADVVMEVHGTGFTEESVVQFNAEDRPTEYISETELTITVQPSQWSDGVVPVRVKNGDQLSEPVEFEFIEAEAPASRQTKRTKPKPVKKNKR